MKDTLSFVDTFAMGEGAQTNRLVFRLSRAGRKERGGRHGGRDWRSIFVVGKKLSLRLRHSYLFFKSTDAVVIQNHRLRRYGERSRLWFLLFSLRTLRGTISTG